MADFFTNKYLEMAKECIPTKVVNIRRTDKPWFNSEIRHPYTSILLAGTFFVGNLEFEESYIAIS
jgi:hypothetical protein